MVSSPEEFQLLLDMHVMMIEFLVEMTLLLVCTSGVLEGFCMVSS